MLTQVVYFVGLTVEAGDTFDFESLRLDWMRLQVTFSVVLKTTLFLEVDQGKKGEPSTMENECCVLVLAKHWSCLPTCRQANNATQTNNTF